MGRYVPSGVTLVLLALFAVTIVLLFGSPGAALAADATACATPTTSPAGVDADAAATYQLEADADTNCQAMADRLDKLDGDVNALDGDVNAAARTADTDSGEERGRIEAISTAEGQIDEDVQAVNSTLQGQGSTTRTVELGPNSSAQMDAEGNALHVDLWVIVGAIVGLFALGEILRKVWP